MSNVTVQEFNRLVEAESPFGVWLGLRLEEVSPSRAVVRLPYRPDFLRPGNAVNGPVLMAVADYAMYALVMSLWPGGEAAVPEGEAAAVAHVTGTYAVPGGA